jgi:hypothetical protein
MANYGYDSEYPGVRKFLNPQDPKLRIGLMVLLVAAGLYFLWSAIGVYFFSAGSGAVMSDDWRVACVKCNVESVVSRQEQAGKAGDGSATKYPDCPKCGQAKSCVDMTVCPKCDKRFASDASKALCNAVGSEKPVDTTAFDLICPHCKHDLKGASAHE